jgi:hypothetical protein
MLKGELARRELDQKIIRKALAGKRRKVTP